MSLQPGFQRSRASSLLIRPVLIEDCRWRNCSSSTAPRRFRTRGCKSELFNGTDWEFARSPSALTLERKPGENAEVAARARVIPAPEKLDSGFGRAPVGHDAPLSSQGYSQAVQHDHVPRKHWDHSRRGRRLAMVNCGGQGNPSGAGTSSAGGGAQISAAAVAESGGTDAECASEWPGR